MRAFAGKKNATVLEREIVERQESAMMRKRRCRPKMLDELLNAK
jgi:hypothetical protein